MWFIQQQLISHTQVWRLESPRPKALSSLIPGEGFGLQMAFSLYLHMAKRVISLFSYKATDLILRAPPLQLHLALINSPEVLSPSIITLKVRDLIYTFWGET